MVTAMCHDQSMWYDLVDHKIKQLLAEGKLIQVQQV
jgi:hypothetical protein